LGLHWRDNCWQGQLQGEPDAFLAALPSMDARLISLNLARASLEEFFIDQLRQRGMTSSQ
ncbi:MAG: multidrug ABC transporter ATP-binding protein, partial [Microcystis aeruginosa]